MKTASILIVTRNRVDLLRRAVSSSVRQRGCERVLVVDDGSTDGTEQMLRHEFPEVEVWRSPEPAGSIEQRNRGITGLKTDVVLCLDDDAYFLRDDALEQVVSEFSHPRIGAVAFDDGSPVIAPPADPVVRPSFVGCGFAVRRDIFARLGGFRDEIVAYGEERDFSIRLLASGHVVRASAMPRIVHEPAADRNWSRIAFLSRRNDLLYVWHNVPMPYAAAHAASMIAAGLRIGARNRRIRAQVRGFASGARSFDRSQRDPVPVAIYRLQRRVARAQPWLRLDDVLGALPTLADAGRVEN